MTSSTIKVKLEGDKKTTHGEVQVQEWGQAERTKRALKFGGICWLLAIASIVLPLVHFVLVPGFLIAGPIVALYLSRQEAVLLGGSGTCPFCNATLLIVRGPVQFPITELCTSCQRNVMVVLENT